MDAISERVPAAEAAPQQGSEAKKEGGMALVFALLGVTLLSMLAASLMFVTSAGSFASFNFKNQMQAEFAANAGVQKAIDWFITTYAPQWLDTSSGIATTGSSYDLTQASPLYSSKCVTLGSSASFTCDGTVTTAGAWFPDTTNTIQSSFNSMSTGTLTMGNVTGNYSMWAGLLHHDRYKDIKGNVIVTERWQVVVTGTLGGLFGGAKVQETTIIEREFIPLYKDAIRGQCSVYLGGSLLTDSFNSNAGAFGGSNVYTGADAQASVGSNSFIQDVGNGGNINGNAYFGTGSGTCPCSGSGGSCDVFKSTSVVAGQIVEAPGVAFPPPPTFGTANDTVQDCSTNTTYNNLPGISVPSYSSGNGASSYVILPPNAGDDSTPPEVPLTIPATIPATGHYQSCGGSGSTVNNYYLCVPAGTSSSPRVPFYFNNLNIGNGSLVIVRQNNAGQCVAPPAAGSCSLATTSCPCGATNCPPVTLYANESLGLGGNGIVQAAGSDPKNLSVIYTGTSTFDNTGTTNFYGTIYAPYAQVTLKGNAQLYGAISAMNVYAGGNYTVHYDLSLQMQTGYITRFEIINQTRNVF